MVKLAEYSVGCRIMDGYFLINITYNENWNVIPPENDKIEFAQKNGVTYYMAMLNDVSFDEVFNSIKETIDYNIDLQKKVTLFKAKVDELQEIFAKEDLETLRTIQFSYGIEKVKAKEKRKYVRKKDKAEKGKELTEDEVSKESNALVAEPKEKIDLETMPMMEENKAVSTEETISSTTKQNEMDENDYDEVVYEEYTGKETTTSDIVNKVDYMEQLKG